jgi:hypothetical protein
MKNPGPEYLALSSPQKGFTGSFLDVAARWSNGVVE